MNGQLGILDQQKLEATLKKPQSTWSDEEIAFIHALQHAGRKDKGETK